VADLGGIELFQADLDEFSFHPHAHEEFFIALTEGGRVAARYRGETHTIGAGDLIVLNPEEAHAGGPPPNSSWRYRALYLRPALLGGLMAEFPGGTALPRFGGEAVRDDEVAARLWRFHRLAERPESSLERESALISALVRLIGRHSVERRSPSRTGRERAAVRRSMEFMDAHADENVTLETLGEVAQLSPYHLCRVFGEAVGMPPHAYQTHLRIRRARALLRSGLPGTQVAAAAGFYDQAHLTRHFKRIVGVTPGRYARDVARNWSASRSSAPGTIPSQNQT
jgi:AraC-like DNA-binding protein